MIKLNNKEYNNEYNFELMKPKEISYMSVDSFGNIDFKSKNIPTLNENLDMDYILSGFNKNYKPIESDKDTDHILRALIDNQACRIIVPMKFLSYRGTLTKIASFPYENKEKFTLSVIKFKGIVFMWWFRTEYPEHTPEYCKCVYGGFRFEKLMTTNNNVAGDDNHLPNQQFLSMVSSKLIHKDICHDLVYVAEIDCIEKSKNKYVELKTRVKKYPNFVNYTLKRFHFLKWWLQCYLIGIEKVVVGFRNAHFIVENIETFDTNIFVEVAQKENLWEPKVCLDFLGNFLTEIELYTKDFKESDICLVNFNVENQEVTFTKTNPNENPKYDFLPSWFRDKFQEM